MFLLLALLMHILVRTGECVRSKKNMYPLAAKCLVLATEFSLGRIDFVFLFAALILFNNDGSFGECFCSLLLRRAYPGSLRIG